MAHRPAAAARTRPTPSLRLPPRPRRRARGRRRPQPRREPLQRRRSVPDFGPPGPPGARSPARLPARGAAARPPLPAPPADRARSAAAPRSARSVPGPARSSGSVGGGAGLGPPSTAPAAGLDGVVDRRRLRLVGHPARPCRSRRCARPSAAPRWPSDRGRRGAGEVAGGGVAVAGLLGQRPGDHPVEVAVGHRRRGATAARPGGGRRSSRRSPRGRRRARARRAPRRGRSRARRRRCGRRRGRRGSARARRSRACRRTRPVRVSARLGRLVEPLREAEVGQVGVIAGVRSRRGCCRA